MSPQFGNYHPATFGWERDEWVPFTYHGIPFAQGVNKRPSVAVIFTHALDALVPLIPGGLVPGQCWGADSDGHVEDSFHYYGLAFDVNAPENPRTSSPHVFGKEFELPANSGTIVKPFGIEWGGDWTVNTPKDYMHIELHLTPADADALAAKLVHGQSPVPPPPPGSWKPWANVPAGTRTIALWSRGTDVRSLQDVLNKWYPSVIPALIPDGYYGPKTDARVRYFQHRAGLTVDGITGRKTWNGLGFHVGY